MNASSANGSTLVPGSCPEQHDPSATRAGKTLAYCVIILFSLIGNSLVIAVVCKVRRMGTNTNRFIVNMCISDLLVTICVLPSAIHTIYFESWLLSGPVGSALCKLIPFIQDVSAAVSIYSMTVISLDRFYAIVLPMRVHFMTRKRCYVAIALIWFAASALHIPYLLNMHVQEKPHGPVCELSWDPLDNAASQRVYYPILFALLYVIPLLAISVLYSVIIWELTRNQQLIDQKQRRIRNRENREVATMLIMVVVFFAASWAPMNAFAFLVFFTWHWKLPCYAAAFKFVADFLIHSNCALNAFIYFTFNKRYRCGLKQVLSSYCEAGNKNMATDFNHTNGTSNTTAHNRCRVAAATNRTKQTAIKLYKL